MAHAHTAPCVNINDVLVEVVRIDVSEGSFVRGGDVIAAVETDKSVVDVVAERDGYVLKVACEAQQKVPVGAVMFWLGDTADEPVPEIARPAPSASIKATPTAKARAMLEALELDAARIPAAGDRLTVSDIEAWLASPEGRRPADNVPSAAVTSVAQPPASPGVLRELSADEMGMLRTVRWHRDEAVSAYLELEYDPQPWDEYAARYAADHRLLLSPLLPLMAFRLAALGRERPSINATIVGDRRYQYQNLNLGFTVQAAETLYLAVVRDTQAMDAETFITALGEVQRHAMARKLRPEEAAGATLSFSSMARWNVSRHIPILPPHTSLIVAHAAPNASGRSVMGASYDHRLLTGFEVAQVLLAMSRPPT